MYQWCVDCLIDRIYLRIFILPFSMPILLAAEKKLASCAKENISKYHLRGEKSFFVQRRRAEPFFKNTICDMD